jgi:hypothetical protein
MRSPSWRRRGLVIVIALTAAAPARLRASGTSPALVLSAAAGAAVGGQRSVALDGSFDFANAVQVAYPLDLVVFQGSRFVRYRVPGAAVAGDSPELADGQLSSDELDAFGREGSAAPAGVRIVTLVTDRIRVALPAGFAAGPTTAILYAVLPDSPVLSNPIDFTLP